MPIAVLTCLLASLYYVCFCLKQWLLAGKSSERMMMRDMWLESGGAIRDQLLFVAMGDGFVVPYTSEFVTNRTAFPADARLFVAERHNEELKGKMDHLVCFLPGVYALSAHHRTCESKNAEAEDAGAGGGEARCSDEEWLGIARELARTCIAMYNTESGLAPEIVQFSMRRRADEERQHNERQQQLEEAKVAHDRAQLAYNIKRTLIYANTSLPPHDRDNLLQRLDEIHNTTLASLPSLSPPPLPPLTSQPAFVVDPLAKHNLLRPETMESLFVLWRVTHEDEWRASGWRIFSAFARFCRVGGGGYTGLQDVTKGESEWQAERANWLVRLHDWQAANGRVGEGTEGYVFEWSNWKDHMESFWLSETMKYVWLLFSEDDVLPLDEYVFNTEAHPLPVATLKRSIEAAGYTKRRMATEQATPPQTQVEEPPQEQHQQQQQQQEEEQQQQQADIVQPVIAENLSTGSAVSVADRSDVDVGSASSSLVVDHIEDAT